MSVQPTGIARSLFIDGSILAGGVLISVGAGLISAPAGMIVGGVLLLGLGITVAVLGARQ